MTDDLLERKKSGKPGVYALFASAEGGWVWGDALTAVADRMYEHNARIFADEGARQSANRLRASASKACGPALSTCRDFAPFGHFQLQQHLLTVREMLASLGEAHSAFNTSLLLNIHGVRARMIDLTGWRDEGQFTLDEAIERALADVDLATELPIVTGYAQCSEALMGTYDRGYSEVTLSRLAVVTRAREAVIHKEFHLATADPRVVPAEAVRVIGETNYDVADQLSNMGMEAIHPARPRACAKPAFPCASRMPSNRIIRARSSAPI
jgi:aspartate kinase